MSKALKVAAVVVGTVASIALIASGVGAPIGTGLLGVTWGTIAAGAGLLSIAAGLLAKKPSVPTQARDRLYASLDPNAARKISFGPTALATDVRYQAYTGTDQEYLHWIVCVAAHEVEAIDELWFDSEKAWSSSGGVTSKYSGYLTVTPRLVGTSGNGIGIDAVWTSACTLTGCAYLHVRFKLTGNSKKAESPFASSVPNRITIRGKGAKVPDPRFSTAEGGSGAQDMSDQSTWAYSTASTSGRNPACQLLFYLLGWRINGKLSVGRGIPPARIDMASFIAAANMCDESVSLAAGGTETRYTSGAVFSEGDAPGTVTGNLLSAMNAVLRDDGGKISLHVVHNDLADPDAISFSEDDILGDESWKQTPSIEQTFNIVRGRYVDASDAGLYQLAEAPEVELTSFDGIDRIDSFDLACVQSASQWQRLAKQRLQRAQYAGVYSGTFNARAWGTAIGRVVKLSHSALGWEDKLFRVTAQGILMNGGVPLVLQEEHESIYAWDEDEAAPITAAVPTVYDPTLNPIVSAIGDAAIADDLGDLALRDDIRLGDTYIKDSVGNNLTDTGTHGAKNSGVTLGANGALGGGGGGQATLPGMGFAGDFDATNEDNFIVNARLTDGTNNYANVTAVRTAGTAAGDPAWYWRSTGTNLGAQFNNGAGGAGMNVLPGETVYFSGITRSATASALNFVRIFFYFFRFNGTLAGLGTLDLTANHTNWTAAVGSEVAPAETAYARFEFMIVRQVGASVDFATPRIAKTELGATNGAIAGTNLLDSSGAVLGDNAIKNAEITIDPDGTLNNAGGGQVTPTGMGLEDAADVTKSVGYGPFAITMEADYTGAIKSGQLSRNFVYKLVTSAGTEIGSGVTWHYRVLTGNVNNHAADSVTWYSMTGTGSGTFSPTAFSGTSATVQLRASYGGRVYLSPTITITRVDDPAPTSGGGGGGGGGTVTITSHSPNLSFNSTSYVDISTAPSGTMPTGKTTATINVALNLTPQEASPAGTWNIDAKVQRLVGAVWTDIGSAAASNPDPVTQDEGGGLFTTAVVGELLFQVNDTGLTAGSSYDWRLVAKLTSGSKSINVTGSVTVTA